MDKAEDIGVRIKEYCDFKKTKLEEDLGRERYLHMKGMNGV